MNSAMKLQLERARILAQSLDAIALPLVASGISVADAYRRAIETCDPPRRPVPKRPPAAQNADLFAWRRVA